VKQGKGVAPSSRPFRGGLLRANNPSLLYLGGRKRRCDSANSNGTTESIQIISGVDSTQDSMRGIQLSNDMFWQLNERRQRTREHQIGLFHRLK
jgi:hypothetical protein